MTKHNFDRELGILRETISQRMNLYLDRETQESYNTLLVILNRYDDEFEKIGVLKGTLTRFVIDSFRGDQFIGERLISFDQRI